MAENVNLPDDILVEIFSRIPTKSVGKCKCISKAWQARLSTPSFIKLHLTRKPCQQNLLLITSCYSLHTISIPAISNFNVVSRMLDLQNNRCDRVVGSCNGLVLLYKYEQMSLVNPVTLHQVTIPKSKLTPNIIVTLNSYGFGYEACSDDYKIVSLYNDNHDGMSVDVYSLKTRLWKKLNNFPVHYNVYHHVSQETPGAFLNGAIHWLVSDYCSQVERESVIVAFDLANETLHEIPVPLVTLTSGGLYVADGRLLMVRMLCTLNLDVWMMEEYEGSADSWTYFRVVTKHVLSCSSVMPLCFVGKEEVVFRNGNRSLAVYNITDGTARHIVDRGVIASFLDGGIFADSLVSPIQHEYMT